MPDSDKAFGQAMEQKAPDELDGADRERFSAPFLSVFICEGHHGVFEFFDATVGNRHPVSVDFSDIKAGLKQVCGKAVAQGMESWTLFNPGLFTGLLVGAPDRFVG